MARIEDMADNPIVIAMQEAGLTARLLIVASGTSQSAVYNIINGITRLPAPKLVAALRAFGADCEGIENRYAAWRIRRSIAARAQARAAVAARKGETR
jgi:5-enolpyruvylshikimate-3-phosphate synthase